MADKHNITKEYLHEIFEYKDGVLYWKNSGKKRYNERIAGHTHLATGYVHIHLNKSIQKGHRLIYMMHYGYLPKFIDHIDSNRQNNKIENLREATRSENNCNAKIRKDSASKIKNVSFCNESNKWRVIININKKPKYIGRFEDIELAELVAIMAREKYHGNFANHG